MDLACTQCRHRTPLSGIPVEVIGCSLVISCVSLSLATLSVSIPTYSLFKDHPSDQTTPLTLLASMRALIITCISLLFCTSAAESGQIRKLVYRCFQTIHRSFSASLTQASSIGECCGAASSFFPSYGSRGYGNKVNINGYRVSMEPGTIFTNVVPDRALEYSSGGYRSPSFNSQPSAYNSFAAQRPFSRPSYGITGNNNLRLPFGFDDYLASSYGNMPNSGFNWRR